MISGDLQVAAVRVSHAAFHALCAHAHSVESEEIMGLLLGEQVVSSPGPLSLLTAAFLCCGFLFCNVSLLHTMQSHAQCCSFTLKTFSCRLSPAAMLFASFMAPTL